MNPQDESLPKTDGRTYAYVTGRDGHFLYKRNAVFQALVRTQDFGSSMCSNRNRRPTCR